MVELEKRGVPTVTTVARPFLADARANSRALGLAGLAMAIIPGDALSNLSEDGVRRLAAGMIEQIVEGLTREVASEEESPPVKPRTLKFQGKDLLQAMSAMNAGFVEEGWGDGFPLVPPTEEAVREMLGGTSRSPDSLVCVLEPGMGRATVEKIAVNAVMAGCSPAHLPVIIAAVEAIADPRFYLRSMAVSTSPQAPLIVVNGPMARELNINCGTCALGPGRQSAVNTVIGRAFRLVLMNVAQARAGTLDMDTIGSPNKYSMCLAENEEKNPWDPFHVDRGFARGANTVSVFSAESQINIMNLSSTCPEGILTTFAGTAALPGSPGASWPLARRHGHNLLLMCPTHAAVIASHGWSKQDVKEYAYRHARMPVSVWKAHVRPERVTPEHKWMLSAPQDTLIPVTAGPEWFHIVVVGGFTGKSSYIVGSSEPVTREIVV